MNLEVSGNTVFYHKDKDNGLEHQDWDRGPRNLVVPWATFKDFSNVLLILLLLLIFNCSWVDTRWQYYSTHEQYTEYRGRNIFALQLNW
jgi:hypothetical protein